MCIRDRFYQGDDSMGKTWFISRREFEFRAGKPVLLDE